MSSPKQFVLLVAFSTAATVLAIASCGPNRAACDITTCSTGCCDAEGECQPGFMNDACGTQGGACLACTGATQCGAGLCIPTGTGGTPDAGNCKSNGAGCLSGSECCSKNCNAAMQCAPAGTDGGSGDGGSDGGSDGGTDGGMGSCSNNTGTRAEQVCRRWQCDRADMAEGQWTGSLSGCVAGDNPKNRSNAVKLVNLYRFLANLPEVTNDPQRDLQAQECALMMHANNTLSHTPPSSWTCYTQAGAQAAGSSNIATTPGVVAVDLYMVDPGNATTLGHRRWILSPGLGPIGSGTTSSYSCLWVIGGSGTATRSYVAWPPPGPFPIEAFAPSIGGSINSTGWSIQSNSINLSSAVVKVTNNGVDMPVSVTQLLGGYGSTYALRFNPMGWAPAAGQTYDVTVTGTTTPITYSVEVVDCQ